jgi:hypothetical protein
MTTPQVKYHTARDRYGDKKICKICAKPKPLDEFYRSSRSETVLSCYCKKCSGKRSSIHRTIKPQDAAYVNCNRNNVSVQWFWEQFAKQGGLCAICRLPEVSRNPRTGNPKLLSIDHNHKSGEIRGLLCHRCNVSIAQLDNYGPEWATLAARYLLDHTHAGTIGALVESMGQSNNKLKSRKLHCKASLKTDKCCQQCQDERRTYDREKMRRLRKQWHVGNTLHGNAKRYRQESNEPIPNDDDQYQI